MLHRNRRPRVDITQTGGAGGAGGAGAVFNGGNPFITGGNFTGGAGGAGGAVNNK
jgi:hypothetical protein